MKKRNISFLICHILKTAPFLLILLFPFASALAHEYSYIIVHALNPEGVEIASIEGMNPLSVPLYDGDKLIGVSPSNSYIFSRPIIIASGTHTIKAEFNGITREETVDLQPGEIREITFIFGRTEFDLSGYLQSIGESLKSRTYSGTELEVNIEDISDDPFRTGVNIYAYAEKSNMFEPSTFSVQASGEARLILSGSSFELFLRASAQINEAVNIGNASVGVTAFYAPSAYLQYDTPSFPMDLQSETAFTSWYLQYAKSGSWPDIELGNTNYSRGLFDMYNQSPYNLTAIPAYLSYTSSTFHHPMQCNSMVSISVDTSDTSNSVEERCDGSLSNLRFSSVPFDINGNGVSSGDPPNISDAGIYSIPAGIKIYTVGDTIPGVYGGNVAPQDIGMAFDISGSPERYGYEPLSFNETTGGFTGRYTYYLISGGADIDAIEFLGTSRFWSGRTETGEGVFSSNFWDMPCEQWPTEGTAPQNIIGPPDGKYSCLRSFAIIPGIDWGMSGHVQGRVYDKRMSDVELRLKDFKYMKVTLVKPPVPDSYTVTDLYGNYFISDTADSLRFELEGYGPFNYAKVVYCNNSSQCPDNAVNSVLYIPDPMMENQNYTWEDDPNDLNDDKERTVFWHMNEMHDYFKNLIGKDLMSYRMQGNVDYVDGDSCVIGTINAFYDSNDKNIYFCPSDVSKESDVIYHEYTHGLIDHIPDLVLDNQDESGAMNEGLSDYYAATKNNDSVIGEGIQPPPLRNLTNIVRYDNRCPRETNQCNANQYWDRVTAPDKIRNDFGFVHHNSLVLSGALWDLRNIVLDNDVIQVYYSSEESVVETMIVNKPLTILEFMDSLIDRNKAYEKQIRAAFASRGVGDLYEVDNTSNDPNDIDPSKARFIEPGTIQYHNIVPANDIDWVKITLTEVSDLLIEADKRFPEDTGGGSIILWLFDSDMSSIADTSDTGIPRIAQPGLQPGTYYVRIEEDGQDAIVAYNLSANYCTALYHDADGDGYGDPNNSEYTCAPYEGYVTDNTDCDDNDENIHPDADDICDGINNDCDDATLDGAAEEWYGLSCDGADSDSCEEGVYECVNSAQSCSDVSGDNIEICDGIDNNCDGDIDEGFPDIDNDGTADCPPPDVDIDSIPDDGDGSGTAGDNPCTGGNITDCDDNCINTSNPDQADIDEDGIGDACDSCTDIDKDTYATEGGSCGPVDCDDYDAVLNPDTHWYQDADYDGYGNPAVSFVQCTQPLWPPDYVLDNTDYNDNDPDIYGIPVRIAGANPSYYLTLQGAYSAAANGDIIQAQAVTFNESLSLNLNKTVTISGGYNGAYSLVIGKTTLTGNITIIDGKLNLENFIIQP